MKVPIPVRMLMFAAILVLAWPLDTLRFVVVCALLAALEVLRV